MIIKKLHDRDFTQVDNALIGNTALSWRARGLLIYLLSKPHDWTVRTSQLIDAGPGGKDMVRGILSELADAGYIIRTTGRSVGGKFDGLDVEVHEIPQVATADGLSGPGGTGDGLSGPGEPASSKTEALSNTELSNTEKALVYSESFESLWKTYPSDRRGSKKEVYGKYQATLKRGLPHEDLATATAAYLDEKKRDGSETKYTKLMATFLGPNEHWRGYLPDTSPTWKPSPAELQTAIRYDNWEFDRTPWVDDDGVTQTHMPPFPKHPDGGRNLFDAQGTRYHYIPNSNPQRRQYD